MTGEKLREIISVSGFSRAELADRMTCINRRQDWTRILDSDDVRSSVIEQLARAMGKPVGELYGDKVVQPEVNDEPADAVSHRLIDLLQAKDRQIDKLQIQIDKLLELLGKKSTRK